MPIYLKILLILPMAWSLAARAADPCDQAATQQEMNQCAAQQYKIADQALNQAYKRVVANLAQNKPALDKLREAQRAWIGFRDANCTAQAALHQGGSIQPTILNSCMATVTTTRAEELGRAYLSETSAAANGLGDGALLGSWKSVAADYGLEASFGIDNGVHHYLSKLNGLPFEAGQWQLNGNQLTITANDGKMLRFYHRVEVDGDTLSLYEKDGGTERFRRSP
jgi:uncharacterized protein YecT (DUF1311 family)